MLEDVAPSIYGELELVSPRVNEEYKLPYMINVNCAGSLELETPKFTMRLLKLHSERSLSLSADSSPKELASMKSKSFFLNISERPKPSKSQFVVNK